MSLSFSTSSENLIEVIKVQQVQVTILIIRRNHVHFVDTNMNKEMKNVLHGVKPVTPAKEEITSKKV